MATVTISRDLPDIEVILLFDYTFYFNIFISKMKKNYLHHTNMFISVYQYDII